MRRISGPSPPNPPGGGGGDLFTRIRGMVRKGDPFTCILAAQAVERKASGLHEAITEEIARRGAMTDQELEDLDRFRVYAYSTVRKRRTELFQGGLLVDTGTRTNSRGQRMIVWDLIGRSKPTQSELFT